MSSSSRLVALLLDRLRQVRGLTGEEMRLDGETRFADAVDSMGFVEYLALVAEDCGAAVETVEQAAGRRYGTVGELAAALDAAGLSSPPQVAQHLREPLGVATGARPLAWLAATTAGLPRRRQSASAIDALVGRPSGWLEAHAGIQTRCLWGEEDPLDTAANTAKDCLRQADVAPDAVGALLATSEAPPLLTGLAAALHARLGLSSDAVALEVGGACTGFLAALWTASRLLTDRDAVLVIAVEAPSRWLPLSASSSGEAAALFGDGSAACVLTARPTSAAALPLRDIVLGTDGSAGDLLQVEYESGKGVQLNMKGVVLAQRAVRTMAEAVRSLSARQGLSVDQLAAVVAHGGNGRMPALLARRLGLPLERVWSEIVQTGNLGSASVPATWAVRNASLSTPVIWTAVGAGLQWAATLFDAPA